MYGVDWLPLALPLALPLLLLQHGCRQLSVWLPRATVEPQTALCSTEYGVPVTRSLPITCSVQPTGGRLDRCTCTDGTARGKLDEIRPLPAAGCRPAPPVGDYADRLGRGRAYQNVHARCIHVLLSVHHRAHVVLRIRLARRGIHPLAR